MLQTMRKKHKFTVERNHEITKSSNVRVLWKVQ